MTKNQKSNSVFIVFTASGEPRAVGLNSEEAWGRMSPYFRWQAARTYYRQWGYYGKTIQLPD